MMKGLLGAVLLALTLALSALEIVAARGVSDADVRGAATADILRSRAR